MSIGGSIERNKPPGAGQIATAGAKQRYTFARTAGQVLYFRARHEGPCSELSWRLVAPSGTEIDRKYMDTEIGRVTLPANGAYTVEVVGNWAGTDATGSR